MINEKKYKLLKKGIDKLEKEKSEAIGRLKQIEEALEKEFGCSSIKEGKKLLKKLQKEQKQHEEKFKKEWNMFSKRYGRFLKALERGAKNLSGTIPVRNKKEKGRKEKKKKTKK